MGEKYRSRTGRQSDERDSPRFNRRKLGTTIIVLAAASATAKYYIDIGAEPTTGLSDYGVDPQAEVGSRLRGQPETDRTDQDNNESRSYEQFEPLSVEATPSKAVEVYLEVLNQMIAPGQSIEDKQQLFTGYADAYLTSDWRQVQASFLNSKDGANLVLEAASRVNLAQGGDGQLEPHTIETVDDIIYPVVGVKGYQADAVGPSQGYQSVIPTKYARLSMAMAIDPERERQYFADVTIDSYFNQSPN